jgi:hypothetical protein
MTVSSESTDESAGSESIPPTPPAPLVAAAIPFVDASALAVTIESVRSQVYGLGRVTVIGGGRAAAEIAEHRGVGYVDDFPEYVETVEPEVGYVWIVHGDARPRPDALGALVGEAERNEAALVGSKILDAFKPDRLESVGSATDVFGEPYGGLDPDEVDLEQYDVVRDVSFVSGVSTLVRRDLLRGLGGVDPKLPPVSAGLDLSQRARVAGGRVMVVPSAEVLHAHICRQDVAGWREQAGRMRAMLKSYRVITLVWAVPFGWIVWLLDAIVRLFLGSVLPMRDLVLATWWNVVNLPSTLRERERVRRIRVANDEELFRYQVSGSVRLRQLGTDVGARFGWVIDHEPGIVHEEEPEQEGSAASAVAAVLAGVLIVLGTRALWLGATPAVGYWLPAGDDPVSVLGSYAGGWNPSGLGSAETLHPAAAVVALVQWMLGGWSGAPQLAAFLSMGAGALGIPRLLTRLGVRSASRFFASAVYLLGPFVASFGDVGYWPGLMVLGPLPWLVDAVISPASHGRQLWGKVGRLVLGAGLVAAFAPLALVVPLAATVAALPLLGKGPFRLGMTWWALVAAVAGADLIAPYLLGVPPSRVLGGFPTIEVWPAVTWTVLLGVAAVATVWFAPAARSRAAGWGGTMVALGLATAVIPEPPSELAVAAVALCSLGAALVVGAAGRIDLDRTRLHIGGQTVGAVAGALVIASVLLQLPDGRAGMPEDRWGDALRFAAELESDVGSDRLLLIGTPETLPGDHRLAAAYAYRLVTVPGPTLDQAWLASSRIGDRALADALADIEQASSARPGAMLAEFGIRWVVVEENTSLADRLVAQVDLEERLVQPELIVLENLSFRPRLEAERAGWVTSRAGAAGDAFDGRIRLADNADPAWAPGWSQDDWANNLSGAEGRIWYRADRLRTNLAFVSVALLAAAAVAAVWWRGRA